MIDHITTLETVIALPVLLVEMILIDFQWCIHRNIQILEHEIVIHMDMINLLVAVALLIEVLDTINMVLVSNSLRNHSFLIIDHQSNHLSQRIRVMNNSFNHILTTRIAIPICIRRKIDDDDFEPPRHSTWNWLLYCIVCLLVKML